MGQLDQRARALAIYTAPAIVRLNAFEVLLEVREPLLLVSPGGDCLAKTDVLDGASEKEDVRDEVHRCWGGRGCRKESIGLLFRATDLGLLRNVKPLRFAEILGVNFVDLDVGARCQQGDA